MLGEGNPDAPNTPNTPTPHGRIWKSKWYKLRSGNVKVPQTPIEQGLREHVEGLLVEPM